MRDTATCPAKHLFPRARLKRLFLEPALSQFTPAQLSFHTGTGASAHVLPAPVRACFSARTRKKISLIEKPPSCACHVRWLNFLEVEFNLWRKVCILIT